MAASKKNMAKVKGSKKGTKASRITVPVKTSTVIGSSYSQAVGINVTDIDVTLEFVHLSPRDKKGEVVARITMPIKAGKAMAVTILNTLNIHEAKKKEKRNA